MSSYSTSILSDAISIDKIKMMELEPLINFLFIVHNDIEHEVMYNEIKPLDRYGKILKYIDSCGNKNVYYIGKFGLQNVVLTKSSDMASVDVNSVINLLNSAIGLFKPRFVIMPGICASLDDKIKIGDVVVVNKVVGYETEKRKFHEVIGRYPTYKSGRLYNLFDGIVLNKFNQSIAGYISSTNKSADETCTDKQLYAEKYDFVKSYPKMHKGAMITGEKLLDDPCFKMQLNHQFPEASCLDMEALGVASACIFNQVYDWLIIKGISDLGDGRKGEKKRESQYYAMKNTVMVLLMVFNDEYSFCENEMKISVEKYNLKKVMLSASQCEGGDYEEITKKFMAKLAWELVANNCKIYTGMGREIGDAVVAGIEYGYTNIKNATLKYEDYFELFPFARGSGMSDWLEHYDISTINNANRDRLCSSPNVFIFAFGNKLVQNNIVQADGMIKEKNIAERKNALIIPLPATGGTAIEIYEDLIKKPNDYLEGYFKNKLSFTNSSQPIDEWVDNYVKALNEIDMELSEENIPAIIDKVIEIINIYG